MKSTALFAALVVATTAGATVPALADRIDDRQARQMQRIEQGYRSGDLTRQEYNRLVYQQREIARLERLLERDGRLSYADRAYLTQLQNDASRDIRAERHDGHNGWSNRDRGNGWGWNRGWGRDYGSGYGNYPRRWYQWY